MAILGQFLIIFYVSYINLLGHFSQINTVIVQIKGKMFLAFKCR